MKRKLAVSTVLILFVVTSLRLVVVPTVHAAVLYDSGDPTAAEQLVFEYINRARSDPVAEGHRLGIDIHEGLPDPTLVGPRPPLAMNKILLGIANAHSQDMYTRNYYSHNDLNGTSAFDRITHAGYNYVRVGENMAAAGNEMSAAGLEDFMMVDAGTEGRPHRVNLLDLINSYP
ncbi:MAG: CAP domain-containing protein, partial [Candidatus Bathyarchaeia archaeon]